VFYFLFSFKLQASDLLIPCSNDPKTFGLGPQTHEPPYDLIRLETERLPFIHQNPNLNLWADQLRAWPYQIDGWVSWYQRVEHDCLAIWHIVGIADALSLTISSVYKDESLLKTIGYFWSDYLNCFTFGHALMTPTLMDVPLILRLDIHSSCPTAFDLSECSYKIVDKSTTRNWSQYIAHHNKKQGSVCHREHTAFLNLWLDHFLFCGPSLAPTKNYLSLASHPANGNRLSIDKLFLGTLYRTLSLNTSRLLKGESIRGGGPWWFVQLWCHLYFRRKLPTFLPSNLSPFLTPEADTSDVP